MLSAKVDEHAFTGAATQSTDTGCMRGYNSGWSKANALAQEMTPDMSQYVI